MKESNIDLVKINQQLKRIEIKEFEIENQIVFNFFDNLPAKERNEKLLTQLGNNLTKVTGSEFINNINGTLHIFLQPF